MATLTESLSFALNILKVALGLGFVIFLHELGHFLLAKWNGVKVEKFSIGFGPTLASYRRGVGLRIATGSPAPGPKDPPSIGETEYLLAALPLGGYVKMLGESQEEATEDVGKATDPRAYHNKSVWARMQIITAGVIMNILLGIVCFAFVASQGGEEIPAWVGGVVPGSPAYKAGIRAGDRIVAIDGRRDVAFKHLMTKVSLSAAGQKILFTVKSPGSEVEPDREIEPTRDNGNLMPTIGITQASSLELLSKTPFQAPPGAEVSPARPLGGFEGGDRVVAVGPENGPLEPVSDQGDFLRKTEALRGQRLVVEVDRKAPKSKPKADPSRVQVTVPVHRFLDFGLRMTPGSVVAIRPDSPAQKAGLKVGDRIVAVEGRKDYDPMHLPDDVRAAAGKPLALTVERLAGAKAAETVELTATPDASPVWVDTIGAAVPLDVPGLGLAMIIEPKVQAVKEGSPASKSAIQPGDTIRSITAAPARSGKTTLKPETFELDGKGASWPIAFAALQRLPMKSVSLMFNKADKLVTVLPEPDPTWSHPQRGLRFKPMTVKTPPLGLADSFRAGLEETWENVDSVFKIFKSLFQGRVGADALGGAIPIAQIAYATASTGWTPFIHFLGILSVNLAVLNFLPIPPLDGGQFTFLAAEKVRGKPLPDSFLNILTIGGVIFVLLLIVFINGKDIFQLIQSYF